MAAARTTKNHLNQAGQNLIRILIASYFIAVSIGLIAGTDATPLAAVVLSPEPASLIGRSALFILGYLVLTGIWLRPAAMLLGLLTFWSSYILHFGPASAAPLGDFWRDLALVGALMLTYSRPAVLSLRRNAPIVVAANSGGFQAGSAVQPRRVLAKKSSNVTRLPSPAERAATMARVENIFRDDLEDILAS